MVGIRRKLEAAKPAIEAAIRDAESGTSGEIVVVVCRIAGYYGWHQAIICFLTSIGVLSIAWNLFQGVGTSSGWDTGPIVKLHLGWVILALVVGFLIGQVLVRLFPKMVAIFASKSSMRRHAERAAALAFRRYRVSETRRDTGVMIFLAEMEQTVVVLGDDKISDCITQHDWEDIRDAILGGIKKRQPVEGLINAVELTGNLLRKHVPSEGPIENELADKLYFR
jgi:putative membrane protein